MIDIAIAVYERLEILDWALSALERCTSSYRLILVEGKRSVAANQNLCLDQVKSRYFVLMDDDVLVTPGWLEAMLKCMDGKTGQVQPKILDTAGLIWSADKEFDPPRGVNVCLGAGERDCGQYDYVREARMISGTCCLYDRGVLDAGCRMDENYLGGQWNDVDWSRQIQQKGYKLFYCGKAAVIHYNLRRQSQHHLDNMEYFLRKWHGK